MLVYYSFTDHTMTCKQPLTQVLKVAGPNVSEVPLYIGRGQPLYSG